MGSLSTALAITGLLNKVTAPIIGKAFFAASLKNSLLLWVSFLLFFFVLFVKLYSIWLVGLNVVCFALQNYLSLFVELTEICQYH